MNRIGGLRLAAFSLPIFFAAALANASQFIPLGDLPQGAVGSIAFGISADGGTVVGYGTLGILPLNDVYAFRWTQATGMVPLAGLPNRSSIWSSALALSADGSVAVGAIGFQLTSENNLAAEPVRWLVDGAVESLGLFPGATSASAGDVSADGVWIVGNTDSINGSVEAFLWSETSGMIGLGDLPGGYFESSATGISADGSVVVGVGYSQFGHEAFRWTAAGGMQPLGDVGGGYFDSRASAISADGTTIVGSGAAAMNGSGARAFRWTEATGMQPLGTLTPNDDAVYAAAVSADGTIIVGLAKSPATSLAMVWDEAQGMRDLKAVLAADFGLGASLAGWSLYDAIGISDDGRAIVGYGRNPAGDLEAWLVRLDRPVNVPEPGSCLAAAILGLLALKGRYRGGEQALGGSADGATL